MRPLSNRTTSDLVVGSVRCRKGPDVPVKKEEKDRLRLDSRRQHEWAALVYCHRADLVHWSVATRM